MTQAIVAMGGNLGDVSLTFERATELLSETVGISQMQRSRLFRSAPMGAVAGDLFFNAAMAFATSLEPEPLLDRLQAVEHECGRVRAAHWGPRTLDLDLIAFGQQVISTPRLTVPHPHAWYRRFVLDPVVDVAPQWEHPQFGLTFEQLRDRLLVRPLPIALKSDDLVARDLVDVQLLSAEFPEVRLIESAVGSEALSVVFGRCVAALSHFELRCPADAHAAQFARDVLTAAVGEVFVC